MSVLKWKQNCSKLFARCVGAYEHSQCLPHQDLGLLSSPQWMCPSQSMIGMHWIKWESFDYSNINLHNGRRSARSQWTKWTTFFPSSVKNGMLPWIAGCPPMLQTKVTLDSFLIILKVPWMMIYLPVLDCTSWKISRERAGWDNWCTHVLYMPTCSSCTNNWWEQCSCCIWGPVQADSCHSRGWHWTAEGNSSWSAVIRVFHIYWRSAIHTMLLNLEHLQCVLAKPSMQSKVPSTLEAPTEETLKVPELYMPAPIQTWQLPWWRICLQRAVPKRPLAGQVLLQQI